MSYGVKRIGVAWLHCTRAAAEFLGMGSLGFGFETPEELGDRAQEYYRLVREECMPIGQAINPALAVLNTFMIGPTDEEAMKRSAGGPGFFSYSLGAVSTFRTLTDILFFS